MATLLDENKLQCWMYLETLLKTTGN